MDGLTWLLLGLVLLLLLGLVIVRFSAWPVRHVLRDLGVDSPPSSWLFGHFLLTIRYGLAGVQTRYHSEFKGKKMYGWYDFRTPMIVLRDLDLIKDVCVKHFRHFTDRRSYFQFEPPFDQSLLALSGGHWRKVRTAVSPTFSSGRVKKMSGHVERTVRSLQRLLDQGVERNEEVELKDMMSRFTMDTIASTGFGLDIDTLGHPDNAFCHHAKGFITPNLVLILIDIVCPPVSKLLRKLGYSIIPGQSMKFFEKVVDSALQERRESGHAGRMRDFLDLVLEAEREAGETTGKCKGALSRNEILSQAVLFMFAGYDTVSSVLAFTLFLLAVHPEYQRRVQDELDRKLTNSGQADAVPNCEALQGLMFLDQCINEAMRMFPPGVLLDRVCTEDITLEGVNFTKGMPVAIPVYGIHMDPELWEEPQQFRPERFDPEASESRHQFAFLPYGYGPRNCVGMRLGQLEIRMVLATVLRRYSVLTCPRTVYPVRLAKGQMRAKSDLWVKFKKRRAKL